MTDTVPTGRQWAPLQILLSVALTLLLSIAMSIWIMIHESWTGVELVTHDAGWQVASVQSDSPADGHLATGDVIRSVHVDGDTVMLAGQTRYTNPHEHPTYASLNTYLAFEDRLAHLVNADAFHVQLDDGRRISLEPAKRRPWHKIPSGFWLLHTFGFLAATVGVAVWAFQQTQKATGLLALSGLGFYVATWFHSIWHVREWAIPAPWLDVMLRGNHLGLHLMLSTLAMLIATYPKQMGRWKASGVAVFVALVQINENLQWLDWPGHSFYTPLLVYYLIGIALAVIQWRRAKYSPLDRGALRWVLLSILLAMGAGMISYFLPLLFDVPPFTGITTMVGLAVLMYLGFVLGVLRYRLFDLERWWFMAWAWFLGGLVVILVDWLVISLFGMDTLYALGIALILVGWVYFPIRQWLWRKLTAPVEVRMEQYLPEFVQTMYTEREEHLETVWKNLLQRIYQPLAIDTTAPVTEASLHTNGSRMDVPAFTLDGPGLRLHYSQAGRRLFSNRDRDIAAALVTIAQRIGSVRQAQRAGAKQERQRIQRDLHDDVGGRLLTLIHSTDDERQRTQARMAMAALREVTNALDDSQRYTLADLLDRCRSHLEERLDVADVSLRWDDEIENADPALSPRQFINLQRVVDEATTNALKHARPTVLRARFRTDGDNLEISLHNDGLCADPPSEPSSGRGLHNMRTRLAEIDGSIHTGPFVDGEAPWYGVDIRVPIHPESDALFSRSTFLA